MQFSKSECEINFSAKYNNQPSGLGATRASLLRLLRSLDLVGWSTHEESGRLDRKAFTRFAVGSTAVFSKRQHIEAERSAVSVLIDCSGSMDNDGLKSVTIAQSPRSAVTLRQAGYGARHRHTQDQGDEIIFVVSGSAHVDSGDSAYTIGKNYLQVIPMGAQHNMNLMLGESLRFITCLLYTSPSPRD